MSWHLFATVVAAAGLAVPPAPAPVVTPPTEEVAGGGAETIALGSERYSRLTVPVTIQGHGPFRFMIDTGAQATVVSRSLADRLELGGREKATLVGMASRMPTETVGIPDVRLGSRNFYIRTAPLVEAANLGEADGILGVDSLQHQRVLFDFEDRSLHVADAEELGGNRGFDIVVKAREKLGQLIITEADLDGVKVAVIVDTGAQGSLGNDLLLEKLRRAKALDDTALTDINGVQVGGKMRIGRELVLGRAQIRNFPITFVESPVFQALGLDKRPTLVLGMSELHLFRRVAIDFRAKRVLFDLPKSVGPKSAFEWDPL